MPANIEAKKRQLIFLGARAQRHWCLQRDQAAIFFDADEQELGTAAVRILFRDFVCCNQCRLGGKSLHPRRGRANSEYRIAGRAARENTDSRPEKSIARAGMERP
jgi:hypothetical protein